MRINFGGNSSCTLRVSSVGFQAFIRDHFRLQLFVTYGDYDEIVSLVL